ncbi:MAG: (Fe-S)-binding protein [Candidatus Kapaibacteriales bacterium]
MAEKRKIKITDFSNPLIDPLIDIQPTTTIELPPPYDKLENLPGFKKLSEQTKQNVDTSLDGVVAVGIPKPKSEAEEKELVEKFISGLIKLFSKENNWTFLQPLILSMEHCAKCQTCNNACPIYEASGYQEIYRPTYRAEILRRLYFKYVKPGSPFLKKFQVGDVTLNWTLISRLIELSYRCTICRRCAQNCPIGVDNGLITHELRKLFSQELGIAAKELHEKGTVQQLAVGSSTGMTPEVVKDNVKFIDEDLSERLGIKVESKWDVTGADVLVIHNAGEFLSWPENPAAFAILLDMAGIKWTYSSELVGYDGVNYGVWYDDFQLARVANQHYEIAKKLGVKAILMGECGHESKSLGITAERVFGNDIKRLNAMSFIEEIVFSGKIKFNPEKNNFPVVLHDPCNTVRLMGIVEPQRRVLRYLAPKFREMEPHGIYNYCCGGGSGFAVMTPYNFLDWRMHVSGRKKFKQILDAFANEPQDPDVPKYVCAPCSNCKGQIRDILDFYGAKEKSGIYYGGLVDLVVNAIEDLKEPFIDFSMM